jgi:zinc transport system ATP-binding protein
MQPLLSVRNLTVRYGKETILDRVSFDVERGEYIGLIGPNGAGKTTLLSTILGSVRPSEGEIFVQEDVRIGYVPQSYDANSLFPVSVKEVVAMGCDRMAIGISRSEKKSIIDSLDAVGLGEEFLSRTFSSLSGGQKQRVVIARSLAHKPNVLLFDEPTSGVDYRTKLRIYELLADLNARLGMTILFVSHEVEHIVHSCKRVLCLDRHLHEGCRPMAFAAGNRDRHETKRTVPVEHTGKRQRV